MGGQQRVQVQVGKLLHLIKQDVQCVSGLQAAPASAARSTNQDRCNA